MVYGAGSAWKEVKKLTADTAVQRQIILKEINNFPFSGVNFNLRALPPPHKGWLIELNEDNLQSFSDSRREDVLIETLLMSKRLENLGIPNGLIRSLT